jgi:hypothetical protein
VTAPMQSLPRGLPAPTSATVAIGRFLATAASQIGYREGQSKSGDYNNDNAFGLWYGLNGVSWCAQFVSWAASAAGIPAAVIPRHQYTPTGWNWFTAHNYDVTTPRAGDIMYVYGNVAGESKPRVHHVGIVEKVLSGGRIQTIEGNTNTTGSSQGNGVYRLVRTVSSKLRFGRPPYQLAVTKTAPAGDGTTKPPAVTPTTPEDDMPYTPAQLEQFAGVGVHGQKIGRSDVTIGIALERTMATSAAALAQVAALTAAVQTLAEAKGMDAAALTTMVEQSVNDALADLKITLTTSDADTEKA